MNFTTTSQRETPERQGWHGSPLYGDVERVIFTTYRLSEKFGEIVKEEIEDKEIYKFNSKGDVIERAQYDSDGSLEFKFIFKYDSQGNQIEDVRYEGEIMRPVKMEERTIVYRK